MCMGLFHLHTIFLFTHIIYIYFLSELTYDMLIDYIHGLSSQIIFSLQIIFNIYLRNVSLHT